MKSAKGRGARHQTDEELRLRPRGAGSVLRVFLRRLWIEETGQDLVEYTLLLAFIGLVGAALFIGMSSTTSSIWVIVNSRVSNANQAS